MKIDNKESFKQNKYIKTVWLFNFERCYTLPPARKKNTTLVLNIIIQSQSSIKFKNQQGRYNNGIEKETSLKQVQTTKILVALNDKLGPIARPMPIGSARAGKAIEVCPNFWVSTFCFEKDFKSGNFQSNR